MPDISTLWDALNHRGDWTLVGPALASGNDLASAVLISLLTDRQAAVDDEIPDGTDDRRGWWGDIEADALLGSRLWLLTRSKQADQTLQRAYDYIVEALQWLITDDAVARFDITVWWTKASQLAATVVANRRDGTTVAVAYQSLWKAIS